MQPNYYAIIPAEVRYDRELTPNAKLLYGEITALANTKGYCYASNQYFAELYDVDKTRVSKWISSLKQKGYIDLSIDEKTFERHIFLPLAQKDKGGCEKGQAPLSIKTSPLVEKDKPPCPKGQHNNTVNNTEKKKEDTPKPKGKPKEEKAVKTAYRDNVLLAEAEYKTLVEKHGQSTAEQCLDKLSAFKLAKGKTYESDYGAINMWVVNAVAEDAQRMNRNGSNRPPSSATPPRPPDPNPSTFGTPASAEQKAARAQVSMQAKREREAAELPF